MEVGGILISEIPMNQHVRSKNVKDRCFKKHNRLLKIKESPRIRTQGCETLFPQEEKSLKYKDTLFFSNILMPYFIFLP